MSSQPRYETIRRFARRHRHRHGYLGRQARRQQALLTLPTSEPPDFDKIIDHENLLKVYNKIKNASGQAAGPDRVTYGMLDRREVARIMRGLSQDLRNGTFRPSRARHVRIPKSDGGHRTLSIRSICFRVVSAALYQALTPYWESVFWDSSMGFRPHRGVWTMLLEMERIIVSQDRWVIATADIKKAFDNININLAMEDYHRHITDQRLLGLLETVLRGHEGQTKTVGIDQGSGISPQVLNVTSHHRLDTPFRDDAANPPALRYADNSFYLCTDVAEGHQAIQQTRQLLEAAGMSIKAESVEIIDLHQGGQIQVLGFVISQRTGQIHFGLPNQAWQRLKDELEQAHRNTNCSQTAYSVVKGWLAAYGPALESETVELIIGRVMRVTAEAGFREFSQEQVRRYIQGAVDRWRAYRAEHQRKMDQQHPILTDAAPPAAADRTGRPAMPEAEVAVGEIPGGLGCPFDLSGG